MPYKPWTITLISLIYFFSPPFILISSALISMVPLFGESGILMRLTPGDISILLAYYLISISVFSVKRWGWWSFIALSLYLIGYNVIGYLMNPFYSPLSLAIYNLLLTLAAALFFRREYIAPYFNPRLRWWEAEKRYTMNFECKLNAEGIEKREPIVDISKGGCFVATRMELDGSEIIPLEISFNGFSLSLKGQAVRHSENPIEGWGIVFKEVTHTESKGIKELMERLKGYFDTIDGPENCRREYARYSNPYRATLSDNHDDRNNSLTEIQNISKTGCRLLINSKEEAKIPSQVKVGFLALPQSQIDEATFKGKVIWHSLNERGIALGIDFYLKDRSERSKIRNVIRGYRRLGARDRRNGTPINEELIDKSLEMTPLALFRRGKRSRS